MSIVLYSADRRGRYNANALMDFSSMQPPVTDTYAIDSFIGAKFNFKISEHGLRYLFPRRELNGDDLMELIVELVRQMQFPEKPSRYQSIFACKSIEDADSFRKNTENRKVRNQFIKFLSMRIPIFIMAICGYLT